MAKRITQLTELTATAQDDVLAVVDISTGQTKKVTIRNLVGLPDITWTATGETWTYSAWNATTRVGSFTVPTDATTKYTKGMRVRFSQTTGGTKYGIIVDVAATVLQIYLGTDYTLNNETVTSPVYSSLKAPFGFPLDPAKWTITTTDATLRSQASPVANTWYNLGSANIIIPPGSWDVTYTVAQYADRSAAGATNVFTTLSTANNSESDQELTGSTDGANVVALGSTSTRRKTIVVSVNTTYYVNTRTTATSLLNIYNLNDRARLTVRATCGFL